MQVESRIERMGNTPRDHAAEPFRCPVEHLLDDLHERLGRLDGGALPTYIPKLADVDPSLFGIAVATVDGAVYEAGDTRAGFTLQSISKPLTYALALERLGAEAVGSASGSSRAATRSTRSRSRPRPARPLERDGQRGGDHRLLPRRRRGRRSPPCWTRTALRGTGARRRRGGLRVRARHRAPQPRDRAPAADFDVIDGDPDARSSCTSGSAPSSSTAATSRSIGGDARERRRAPAARATRAVRAEVVRDVLSA